MIKRFFILLLAIVASVGMMNATPAELPGAFTVNSGGDQVYFSKGNLQATTTDLGEHWSWDFAEHQWDIIGNAAANNSINGNGTVSANGTVDMFGWSTSANYYGINNSQEGTDYAGNFKDWGETIDDGWRTLTFAEWRYLLEQRAGTRYCKATVNSKTGLVIFPDNYSHPAGVTDVASANTKNADFATNSWSGDDWTNMETAGAVFLPMAGCRFGTSFMFQSTNGFYWSSTPYGDDQIYRLNFKSSDMDPSSWYARYGGMFVRLVYEAPAPAEPIPCTAADLGKVLCTDGSIYATVSEATAAGKTAVAMIAYVDTENGKALALALADESGDMQWETAKTTAPAHTPAVSNGTWTLASKDDWDNMITAAGGYEALRDGFSSVGGTNMNEDKYWSSTPENTNAWCYYFNYGMWVDGYVDNPCYVRACLAFDIPAAPAYETVMNLINAIGTVELTAECKAKIDAARAAYDAMSDGDKAQVTNIATLTTAETDYAALAAAAAAPVIAQIEALPTTIKLSTYFSTYDLMVAARAAYNALSAEVQAAVTNLSKLTNLEAAFAAIGGVNEKLSKPFSVGEGQVVYFSHGNLQATYNGSNWSWAFAAHQYDYIGDASGNIIINGNGTLSGAGTVDLFGWVANSSTVLTSGVAKYGVSNSTNVGDYGLGTTETLKGDWGVAANDANIGGYNDWRILSNDEWVYLFKTRTDAASKYGYATVGGVNGVIIIPDAFTDPMKNKGNLAFRPQNVDKGYSTNVYTTGGDWEAMEAAGAVFMPAAGRRYGTTMTVNEGTGFYWSSTPMSYQASYFMGFMGSNVVPNNDRYRSHGLSVRLVSNNAPVVSTPLEYALAAVALINAIPTPVTLDDACKDAIDAARAAVDALGANANLIDDADMNKLTQAETDYANAKQAADQAAADPVTAKINAIPQPVTLKLATRDSIESARAAYDALTADQKALVTNYDVLTAAEAALAALNPGGAQTGAVNGKFSISNGNQIAFSKGNLQYQASTGTWRFAANQYDAIGDDNSNISPTYTGWIDLFGWGTGSNPTITSTNNDDYTIFVDWGDNAISNGGNEANLWRTLTNNEWKYLFQTRTDAASKYGIATVADVHGLIILPDDYAGTAISTGSGSWDKNTISAEDWAAYEAKGAVFLPTTGYRYGTTVNGVDARANYWSSTFYMDGNAYDLGIEAGYVYTQDQYPCGRGFPVRLVTENAGSPAPLDSAQAVKDLIDAIPVPVTLDAACVNAVQAARDAYNALSDEVKGALDDATAQKLNQAIADYTALIQAGADKVIAKINEIPSPMTAENTKLSVYQKVQDARAAYDALTADQQALVSNYSRLTDAEAAFAAIPPVGSETVITWDKNTGIEKISGTTTSPAYEGITISIKGGGFGPQDEMLRFNIAGLGLSFEFANTLGGNFQKIVISSTNAMPSTPLGGMGEGWTASSGNKIATWTGDAATVKIWDGLTATSYWDVNTIQFTLGATVSATEAAQAALDKINAIPQPVVLSDECNAAIKAAREAVDALGANASLIDDADLQKLTDAEAALTALNQAVADEVIAKINNIPQPVTLKLATRDSINNARAAYDALTADQQALVSNYDVLTAAEAALAALNPGGGAPAGALNGKFTINAGGDQIAFSNGNLQATTTDLGAHWTWGFAANQWDYLGIAVANSKINGNGTVSENGTVDLFGWSTAATYYGINNSDKFVDYPGDFVDWGPNMGAGWRTLTKDEWNYLIENNTKGRATVNDKNGYIFLPNDWSGPAFTPDPNNFTTNVYSGDDWTAMENAGAVFLPCGPARNRNSALVAMDVKYYSSTSLNNDSSYVFTIYYNQSQSACTGTNRAYGCMVRLVTEGGGATPLDSAQVVKDLIDAIPMPVTLDAACVNAVQAARDAYNALSDEVKGALDPADVKKLTDAEAALTALNQAEADKVVAKINNIPTPVELKLATRDSINNARAAYDALTDDQKLLVSNYQTLLDAEAALAELNKGGSASVDIVWDINTGINEVAINTTSPAYKGITVTTGKGNRFYQATTDPNRLRFFFSGGAGRYAFAQEDGTHFTKVALISSVAMGEWLREPSRIGTDWVVSDDYKKATWIGDADTVKIWDGASATAWVDVDSIVFTVNAFSTPLDSAQAVKDLIDAIPTPVEYPTSGPAVAAALNAFNQLSDAAKGALDDADVQKLNDVATQYAALEAIAAIENIPAEIVYDPAVKAAIETARDKYDALSDPSKALVDDEVVAKLTNAEQAWADLVALIEHNVSYMGKDGELKNEKVALLHIPDPAPEFNGYEFVRWDVKAGDFLEEGLRIKAIYTPIITTDPEAIENLVYNGTAQTLITAGVAKEGHIEYRINDGEWSAELPKADMAAVYAVYYKLVREGHADYIADPINVTIAKAPVAYTAPTAVENLVYTAANQTLIAAGQTNDGTFEYSLDPTLLDNWKAELPQAKDAGTYSVYYRVKGDLNHLDSVAATPVAVTIAKAELTATADDKNVTYGDAVPEYSITYTGWQGDDDETMLTGELAFACTYAPTSNVGEYTITPSGVSAANYDITFVNGKVTVAQATLTVTAENKTVTYGDAAPEFTVTYEGWKNSDDASVVSNLAYTCDYLVTSNVGNYTITPHSATALNYAFVYVNGTLTVNQAALMITAENKEVTYGDAVLEYTATYSGWKNSDDESVVTGLVYTCEYAPTSNVGEYTITPSGAAATNYTISYTNGKVIVGKADLMITAENKNVIYGDAIPEYTATYSGWKNSDDASVVSNLAYTCEYAPTSNVGEYTITPNSATAQNYAISYTNGKVTVAQATLTVTAENKTVTYGDAAPEFTVTYEGWKNSDDASVVSNLAYTCDYLVTSNVGNYTITPHSATALNYAFVYVNGTLTVNQAALMITAENKEVTYGDAIPEYTATYSGWKNSDDASVVSNLAYTCEYAPTSNVGEYTITPSGAAATNYTISYTNGKVIVGKADLMITAENKNVIYGDAIPEYTATYSGWKNSDDASVVSNLAYTCEYAPTSNVGEYTITPNSATAQNYAISYTNGKVTVAQAALTITAEDKVMIYGDEHPEFTVTYSGWKNSDDESVVSGLQFSTPYAPGSYIGTYAINPNSATALNYAITFVDGTLTVNKAHVYVSDAEAQIAKFADGHANAVVLEQGILNGIKLNDPIAHVTTAAFSSADVAEHLTITLFYELTGDDALLTNYDLIPTSEVFTTEGVIIEPFIPDNEEKPEDEEATVNEGIEIYAYGYCDGSGYSLKYHLESGNPDQYKIDFADSRFTDVDWTNLEITGKDGTIDIEIPVDLPTGDYSMTVYFRDSRFDWLESRQLNVTFHVNLPETYVRPLFDNVIALVDTCHCLTDIQWYWRANSSEPWQPIDGANGYYYHVDGKLTGEYFVKANMNGEPTYTCGQSDMETLYGAGQKAQAPDVRAYPNPVESSTTVTIENSEAWKHNLRIVNLVGVEVMNTSFEGPETTVEMGTFSQGNYLISVDGVTVNVLKK